MALGVVALPRGGTVNVEIAGTPPDVSFVVRAKGDAAKLNDEVKSLLAGANGVAVDSHSIQPYYARRVAAAAGMTITAEAARRRGRVQGGLIVGKWPDRANSCAWSTKRKPEFTDNTLKGGG